jgi:hypothetical protein
MSLGVVCYVHEQKDFVWAPFSVTCHLLLGHNLSFQNKRKENHLLMHPIGFRCSWYFLAMSEDYKSEDNDVLHDSDNESSVKRREFCQARGLSQDHNANTAFFDIPVIAPHGLLLACSNTECALSQRRFRYCRGMLIRCR